MVLSLVVRRSAATALLASALAGCGARSGSDSPPPSAAAVDPATSLVAQSTFTDGDVRHLLVRTRFGVTETDIARIGRIGVAAFVDAILHTAPVGTQPFEAQARSLVANPAFPQWNELVDWWLRLLETNPNPTQEVLALFWHDYFGVSQGVLGHAERAWMLDHVDLLRGSAMGNARDLLLAMARDWSMLQCLDGLRNSRFAPNENFAREFFELYALGLDNGYTDTDIAEAARAFTGYDYRVDPATGQAFVVFEPNRHDTHGKQLFGVTIPGQSAGDDFAAVVDTTLAQRPAAEWLSTCLLEYFCYPNPPARLVSGMAQLLRQHNYELAPVLRTLFTSRAFYSDRARFAIVRSPLETMIALGRSTGLRVPMSELNAATFAAGQQPTLPPSIEGWPNDRAWLSTHASLALVNFAARTITARSHQTQLGVRMQSLLPHAAANGAEAVDHLVWLLRVELTPGEHGDCVAFMNSFMNVQREIVPDPFDPTDPQHLDERLRGLVYILAQHPTYFLR